MNVINFLKIYLVTIPIFFLVDLVWLGFIAKNVYQKYIGSLMKPTTNWPAAFLFYMLFIVGLVIFAIYPAIKNNSWSWALWYGSMFGFFTYMTFDLTNLAILKNWPWQIALVDIAWGMFLSAIVSVSAYFMIEHFFNF